MVRTSEAGPAPRTIAAWMLSVLVLVTGVGLMAAWFANSPTPALGADEPSAPQANPGSDDPMKGEPSAAPGATDQTTRDGSSADPAKEEPKLETATFGAGCFWGVQVAFDRVPGVVKTTVGFMGGSVPDVTYTQVCRHDTGHAEVVQVQFDPAKVSYEELLFAFWHAHDPTTVDRQGPDVGDQYRSAIFYENDAQKDAAEKSKAAMQASAEFRKEFGDRPIVTEITEASAFYAAEEYHQKYFEHRGMAASCHRGW